MANLYLGIDGGGTKTAFAICDASGKILSTREGGTAHLKQAKASEIEKEFNENVHSMLNEIGADVDDIVYAFAGVPGFDEFPEVPQEFEHIMTGLLNSKKFSLGNDCVSGWAGSQAGKPGVNMVLGTGAIAYGIDYKGNEARSSGWGPLCGDEASAYWIGQQAIHLFGKQSDGRVEKSHLYDIIRKKFAIESDFDFIQTVIDMNDDRKKIAEISMLLSEAAKEGDNSCIEVINFAAEEVVSAILAVVKKLDFDEKDDIYFSYSGGVFKMGSILTDRIENKLDNRFKKVDSILSPVAGSCLMAMKKSGVEISDEIIGKLR